MTYKAFSEEEKEQTETNGDLPHPPTESQPEALPETSPPNRPRPSWLIPMFAGVGMGAAIVIGATRLMPNPNNPAVTQSPSVAPTGTSITVAPVTQSRVNRTLEATGTVAAYDLIPVLPQITGLQIRKVLVEEGESVQPGQVLVLLDDSILQTQLSQALAQLEASQANVRQRQAALNQARTSSVDVQRTLDRYQSLANQGAISKQELDTRRTSAATASESVALAAANISSAEADVRNSAARVRQLQTQIEQTLVRAPAGGIVAEKMAHIGDVTSNSQKLFSMIRNGSLELQVKVPETQLSEVKIDASVRITSDADPKLRLQGKVREIAPLVDAQTRQATVKIDLYSASSLRPGMFLRAAIVSRAVLGLTVPASAVLPQADGKKIVYLLTEDDTVKAQPVEVGTTTLGEKGSLATATVEIISGLKVGDRVAIKGASYLKDGDKVEVVGNGE